LNAWRERLPADLWRERLTVPEDDDLLQTLRVTTHTGRPNGSSEFLGGKPFLIMQFSFFIHPPFFLIIITLPSCRGNTTSIRPSPSTSATWE